MTKPATAPPAAAAAPARPAYEPPAIVYEAALEVRAGTPLGQPDPLDPLDPLGLSGK